MLNYTGYQFGFFYYLQISPKRCEIKQTLVLASDRKSVRQDHDLHFEGHDFEM